MGYRLGKRSLSRLEGVHPDLVRVVKRAITYTTCDFTVMEGVRSIERQRKLVAAGSSKIMHSRHLTGHAVDLGAWIDNQVDWGWPPYYQIADAMKKASTKENVPIRWGGDWDSDGDYEDETWRDGPHFELPRTFYPS